MKVRWCLLLTVLFAVSYPNNLVFGFNVDTVNYIRHEVQPDSMFGFSVALHKEQQKSWVIIGAPEADSLQPGVKRGGVVYRCDISDDNRCQPVPFDTNGPQMNTRGEQTDTKSNQWFGATVASAGVNGPLVACAPRYVYHTLQPRKVERNEPVGTCYLLKNNFTNSREISPCRTSYWGYHRQGSCQAGLSAAITKDGKRLFVGAPGSWYWQGQIYSTDLNYPENKVYSTGESTSAEDDSYLGYSTVTGDFDGDGVQDVAVGMPRGGGLLGKVLIFSWDMINQDNITGEQIGSYFGYSLCTVDVDGDGLDDLLIGAPMYTEPNNEGKYEMGRVYIMFQGRANKFKTLETRDGVNSRGRFGLSLTSLGDMNLDGFGDFAVGAPYDGPNNNGAVYIYHGSKTGPLVKYSQVIFAEDLRIPYLSTFGFSLSGGLDLDGNLYPDLVVGAYASSKAIFFKSRPVAVMEASTLFNAESKLISLDSKNCKTPRDRLEVTCTSVKSCLKYNGINLPSYIDIDVSWVLDAKKIKSPRMFFLNDEGKNIRNSSLRLQRGKPECREEEVYIIDNIRDKLTPLEVEMRYQLRQTSTSTLERRKRAIPEPVIDTNLGLVQRDSINIQKNCGSDNICIPDLRLSIKTVDQYLLGSKELLNIEVMISNHGEDAFEAGFYMTVPGDLNFKKIERIGDIRDTPITCTAPSPSTNHTLRCDIGNPLSTGKIANFKVIMIPSQKSGMAPSYDFYMEANSTNTEIEGSGFDNVIKKSIGIWIETDLKIEGTSIPDQMLYNISEFKSVENATNEHELGPQVVHMYNIRNKGPSTIEEAEVYLLWPYETKGGDFLMYLLNQPETSGNIKCAPTTYANQRDIKLDSVLSRKSYLESSGAVEKATSIGWYDRQHGVYTEHSSSSSSSSSSTSTSRGSSSSGGRTFLSEADKQRLAEEDNLESKGDASYIHTQRANAAATTSGAGGHRGMDGARGHTYQTSWSSSSQNGGPPVTVTASRNRTMVRGPDGNYITSESSTEHIALAGFGHRPVNQYDAGHSISASHGSQSHAQSSGGHATHQGGGYVQTGGQQTGGQYYGGSSQSNFNRQGSGQQTGHYQGSTSGQQSNQYQASRQGAQSGGQYYGAVSRDGGYREQHGSEQAGQYRGEQNAAYGGAQHHGSTGYGYQSGEQAGAHRSYQGQQSGGARQNYQGQSQFEGNRIEGTQRVGYGQSENIDSIDLEAQRQAYAEQSGSASRRRMKSQQDGEPPRTDLITGATGLEELAQGGQGFKATTFDLGISNRGNVDDELRQSGGGGASQYSQSQYSQSQSGGGSSGGSSSGSSAGSSGGYQSYSSGSSSYGSNMNHGRGGAHYGNYNQGQGMQSDPKLTLYPRVRRSTEDDRDRELEKALHCDIVRCAAIRCTVGPLHNEKEAWIAIRTRLVATTMHKLAPSVPLNISTRAVSRVTKLPYIGTPKDMPIKSHEILFTAIPEQVPKPDVVPLWVVVLSACAGAIILLLLVFLLYKCGFFNRNRPSDSSERQPLNRNGNYHGDEHL